MPHSHKSGESQVVMGGNANQSEVARLLQEIEQEWWSADNAVRGFAHRGRHCLYQARMQHMEQLAEKLQEHVPPGQAYTLITGRIAESGAKS